MTEFDLWADENEPVAKFAWRVYRIGLSPEVRSQYKTAEQPYLYVGVEESGLIQIEHPTYWFGKDWRKMDFDEKKEVYDWLTEWEYAVWRRIGPEDSELFATKKLDPEFGLEEL